MERNYGYLAKLIETHTRFKRDFKDNCNNSGKVRNAFGNYNLIDYKIIRIKKSAPAVKTIDVSLYINVYDKIYDVLKYNDDKYIDVEFRVLLKSGYDSELTSE